MIKVEGEIYFTVQHQIFNTVKREFFNDCNITCHDFYEVIFVKKPEVIKQLARFITNCFEMRKRAPS